MQLVTGRGSQQTTLMEVMEVMEVLFTVFSWADVQVAPVCFQIASPFFVFNFGTSKPIVWICLFSLIDLSPRLVFLLSHCVLIRVSLVLVVVVQGLYLLPFLAPLIAALNCRCFTAFSEWCRLFVCSPPQVDTRTATIQMGCCRRSVELLLELHFSKKTRSHLKFFHTDSARPSLCWSVCFSE